VTNYVSKKSFAVSNDDPEPPRPPTSNPEGPDLHAEEEDSHDEEDMDASEKYIENQGQGSKKAKYGVSHKNPPSSMRDSSSFEHVATSSEVVDSRSSSDAVDTSFLGRNIKGLCVSHERKATSSRTPSVEVTPRFSSEGLLRRGDFKQGLNFQQQFLNNMTTNNALMGSSVLPHPEAMMAMGNTFNLSQPLNEMFMQFAMAFRNQHQQQTSGSPFYNFPSHPLHPSLFDQRR
jgi:hypothetical protein